MEPVQTQRLASNHTETQSISTPPPKINGPKIATTTLVRPPKLANLQNTCIQ